MSIMVECNSCGKQYSAEPAMAGKRVKCKQCGNVFQIPMSVADGGDGGVGDESQDDLSALTALAELERSRSGEAYQPPAAAGSRGGGGIRGGEGLARSSMARTGADKEEIPVTAPEDFGRPSVRFAFPFAKELDIYGPWTVIIAGFAIVALACLRMDPPLGEPNAPSASWIPWVRLAVLILMYVALVAPLSLRGVRMAGKKLRFQMPRKSKLRAYASFIPAFVLGVLMYLAGGGETIGLVLGVILGLVLSFGLVHFFFRLRFNEMPVAASFSGGMFALGTLVSVGIVVGLNLLLTNVMVATKKADRLAGSPFAAGLSWPRVEQTVQPKPRPLVARNTPPTTSTTSPSPEAIAHQASPTTQTSESLSNALSEQRAAPPPPPAPEHAASSAQSAPQVPVVTEAQTTPNVHLPAVRPSPLVKQVTEAPLAGGFLQAIFPAVPGQGQWLAVTRGGPDSIERWSAPPGQEWSQEGAIARMRDVGASNRYVMSPEGSRVARTALFPQASLVAYPFGANALSEVMFLEERPGLMISSDVIGFASPERVLVVRTSSSDGAQLVENWDVQKKSMLKRFDVAPHDRDAITEALSPDGQSLAIAARGESPKLADKGPAAIYLYDVAGPRGGFKTKIPMNEYRQTGVVSPTALAFSPDSKKICILLEQQGNGFLMVFNTSGGRAILARSYPPLPAQRGSGWRESSIIWLDNNVLLLYGQAVLNAITGDMIGETGFPDPEQHHFSPPDVCELVYMDGHGARRIALLQLDMKPIAPASRE